MMMSRTLVLGAMLASLVACNGSKGPNTEAAPPPPNVFEVPEDRVDYVELDSGVERFTSLAAVKDLPSRIALAPATWVSEDGEKIAEEDLDKSFRYADILSQQLQNAFVATPYRVVPPLAVIDKMAEIGINPRQRLSDEDAARLAKAVGVGAVLRPEITVSEINVIFAGEISGKVALDMIDQQAARLVGLRHEVARGEGGVPLTIIEAVVAAVSATSMFNDRNRLVTVFELAHDLADAMPVPANIEDAKVIRGITHSAIGRPARRGEVVWFAAQTERKADIFAVLGDNTRVRLDSEAGSLNCRRAGDSSFVSQMKDLEARTQKPVYFGCYAITASDAFQDVALSYQGWDEYGNPVDYVDYANLFTVDADAPDAPGRLNAVYIGGKFQLSWAGSSAADIAGYRVYASDTPRSGFAAAADTEFDRLNLAADFDGDRYYRVTAFDQAGNESQPSPTARAVKIEAGPTAVDAGDIRVPTEWFAAASPYVVAGDVRIARGAKLIVDPGVRIEMAADAKIIVEGELQALGLADAPIQWSASNSDEPWGGIEIKLRADAQLDHNVITGAAIGLAVFDADPVVTNSQFSRNEIGVLMQDFANPKFDSNIVRQNTTGLKLVQTAASISNGRITANTVGVLAEDSGALIIASDLSQNKLAIRSISQGANTPPFADDDLWGLNDIDEIKAHLVEGPVIISNIRKTDERRATALQAQLAGAGAVAVAAAAPAVVAATPPVGDGLPATATQADAASDTAEPIEDVATDSAPEGPTETTGDAQPVQEVATATPKTLDQMTPGEQLKYAYDLMRDNDYEAAQEVLEPLAAKAPRNADLHNRLAILRYQNGNLDGAIESINRAVTINPFAHHFLLTAAKFQIQKGDRSAAHGLLQRAAKIKPNDPNVQALLRITAPPKEG